MIKNGRIVNNHIVIFDARRLVLLRNTSESVEEKTITEFHDIRFVYAGDFLLNISLKVVEGMNGVNCLPYGYSSTRSRRQIERYVPPLPSWRPSNFQRHLGNSDVQDQNILLPCSREWWQNRHCYDASENRGGTCREQRTHRCRVVDAWQRSMICGRTEKLAWTKYLGCSTH